MESGYRRFAEFFVNDKSQNKTMDEPAWPRVGIQARRNLRGKRALAISIVS
jgi:hypothetical protein